jgi:hypothetical protein
MSPDAKKAKLGTYLTQQKPREVEVEDVDMGKKRSSLSRDNSRQRMTLDSSEYKKKIDSVRHRVDCWNRSASMNNTAEFTPMRKNTSFGQNQGTMVACEDVRFTAD